MTYFDGFNFSDHSSGFRISFKITPLLEEVVIIFMNAEFSCKNPCFYEEKMGIKEFSDMFDTEMLDTTFNRIVSIMHKEGKKSFSDKDFDFYITFVDKPLAKKQFMEFIEKENLVEKFKEMCISEISKFEKNMV